ncbi:calcium release-activated calcium channel protein 1-like [Cloeon dipterum]|uniref:calcium release-activated calcium channel protein 1-like n=1 Tax=Cloeon dipterum TaxID=197152 RepID=UPI00321FF4B2
MANDRNNLGTSSQILTTKEGVQWRQFFYGHAKLEGTTKTSIFLAAFGMEVITSFQFTQPTHVPSFLVVLLSVNTVILIALHSFAFIIGTCLLPNLEAVTVEYVSPQKGHLGPVPSFSPHERFSGFIGMSHKIAHVFGLFVFMVEVPLVVWVKLWDISQYSGIASVVTMVPFMVLFALFCWYFNFQYNLQMVKTRRNVINDAENQYRCGSQESIEMSSYPNYESHHDTPETPPLRRSLQADFGTQPPVLTKRLSSARKSVTLETVVEYAK